MFPEPDAASDHRPRYALYAGGAAIATVTVLIIAKVVAWFMTGSASILASLTDSMMDAWVSGINLLAIRYSLKPADSEHRYGHGKVEGIAALFQAALITSAAVFLTLESVSRLIDVREVESLNVALGVMAFSMVMSILLVSVQKYSLKFAPSLAVEADQAHYSTDIIVNAGTILALGIIAMGGPHWLDSAFALVVVGYLVKTAWEIGIKGADMLMDRELPDSVRKEILEIVMASPGISGIHDLRTRAIGMRTHISFDVELDPDLSLRDAHNATRAAERALLEKFPNAEIMIHMDPVGDPADSRHPGLAAKPA